MLRGCGLLASGLTACILCCCNRVPPPDDQCVSCFVKERLDKEVYWNAYSSEPFDLACCIDQILQKDLTADSAVQIALLNNPEIQAVFEEIGIAQADLIEAGLLQNPVFEGYVRFPANAVAPINSAFTVLQTFLDIFLIPLRKRVAFAQFEQAKLRVADAVLNLSFDVQETYYCLQAEQMKLEMLQAFEEAAQAASDMSRKQLGQGNINDLEMQRRMNDLLEAKIAFAKSQRAWIALKEKMNQLMGFCRPLEWHLHKESPTLPEEESSLDCLESLALNQRLDLAAARWEIEKIARSIGIKQWWAYTDASAGISTEKEVEGFQVTGPAFFLTLPIFNYGQAARARLRAQLRQSQEHLKTLEIKALADVRSLHGQLIINRDLVLIFEKEMLPLQKSSVSTSESFYNVMGLSLYKLLDQKKQELLTEINYATILKDYWMSKVALNRALGGIL